MEKLKIKELNRLTVEEFRAEKKTPLVVLLDNVRSLHNVGSVFRTADAFLLEKIYLCGITSTPPNAEIHKTALGAEDTVVWEYAENALQTVEKLHHEGFAVFAIEQAKGSTKLDEIVLDKTKKYAIILGNEVKGVQQAVLDICDNCIEIQQFGTKHSLNVSVTAGIAIWEMFKQLSPNKYES